MQSIEIPEKMHELVVEMDRLLPDEKSWTTFALGVSRGGYGTTGTTGDTVARCIIGAMLQAAQTLGIDSLSARSVIRSNHPMVAYLRSLMTAEDLETAKSCGRSDWNDNPWSCLVYFNNFGSYAKVKDLLRRAIEATSLVPA